MRPDPRQRLLILITYFSGADSVRARLAEWRLVTFLTLFKVQLSLTAWGHTRPKLSGAEWPIWVDLSHPMIVRRMAGIGAEQKFTFWIACFRFWRYSGHCAAGAVEP